MRLAEAEARRGDEAAPTPPTVRRRFRLLRVYYTAAIILVSYGLFALRKRLASPEWAATELARIHRGNARRAMRTILEVQGLFIKVGQLVSILSSVLPADFRDQLAGLQDAIPARPWHEIRPRLLAEVGDPEACFAEIEHQALAAASLAQVHLARLHDGRAVAVKVQHWGIERLARRDLATIRRLLSLVGFFTGARGLGGLFDEVRGMIESELDFELEADHLEAISAGFTDDAMIAFPTVIRELSTRRILVTSYVECVKVSDLPGLDALGIDRPALAERVLEAYCRMIFVHGLYHADPHPGNLLVAADGAVTFIDFGAVGQVSPAMKAGIPLFIEGLLRRDHDLILRALRRLGFVQREGSADVAQRVIDYVYSRFLDQLEFESLNLAELKFDPKMKMELIADLRNLDLLVGDLTAAFLVPREWVLLLRTVVLLMGVCTQLDPAMQPVSVLRPHLEKLLLGNDRDWLALVRSTVKDLGLTALTMPGDLSRMLKKAERGEMAVEVRGLRESTSLLYALGHQMLLAIIMLSAAGLAYVASVGGEARFAELFAGASGVSLLLLIRSWWSARRWQRALRRGAGVDRNS